MTFVRRLLTSLALLAILGGCGPGRSVDNCEAYRDPKPELPDAGIGGTGNRACPKSHKFVASP